MRSDVVSGEVAVARRQVQEWAATWSGAPAQVAFVDGARISDSADLFCEVASALDFPDYFGHNWSALDECLRDYLSLEDGGLGSLFGGRPGVDARGLLLVLLNTGHVLRTAPHLLAELLSSLRFACNDRSPENTAALWVVVHVREEGSERMVREILQADR